LNSNKKNDNFDRNSINIHNLFSKECDYKLENENKVFHNKYYNKDYISKTPKNTSNSNLFYEKNLENFSKNILLIKNDSNAKQKNFFFNPIITNENIQIINPSIDILKNLNNENKIDFANIKDVQKIFVQKKDETKIFKRKNSFSQNMNFNNISNEEKIKNLFSEKKNNLNNENSKIYKNKSVSDKIENKEKLNNIINKSISSKIKNIFREKNKLEASSDNIPICRICYDEENTEKGKLINPCLCTGSMKYIHQSCLKMWIENNLLKDKLTAHCEICKINYQMNIDTKYVFSKKKCGNLLRTILTTTCISGFILALIFIVLYIMISTLTTITPENKKYFLMILSSIGALILLFVILSNFKNYKNEMFNQIVTNWNINSLTGNKIKFIRYSYN